MNSISWRSGSNRLALGLVGLAVGLFALTIQAADCPAYLNGDLQLLRSDESINLCDDWQGQPLLIVNTASFCGFTPQFKALEAIHQRYGENQLKVLGFPSDDFRQEADSEEETAEICYINYGVTFTMLAPVSVSGDSAHPIFKELARQSETPSWNFNKYLVDGEGRVVKHFPSSTSPDSAAFKAALATLVSDDD